MLPTGRTMVECQKEGTAKAVGVSNFSIRHLQELKEKTGTLPAINQVELNPFLVQDELVEYCNKEGIVVMAYLTPMHSFPLFPLSSPPSSSPSQSLYVESHVSPSLTPPFYLPSTRIRWRGKERKREWGRGTGGSGRVGEQLLHSPPTRVEGKDRNTSSRQSSRAQSFFGAG